MTTSRMFSIRSIIRTTALLAAGCALTLALVPVAALKAADAAPVTPPADQGPKLPLTFTFEKVTGGEAGPFVLKLKNTSDKPVAVTAKILLAVAFHADNKAKRLPEKVIAAGQVYSIPDLAVADKVVLTAKGFATLEIVVP